MPFVHMEISVVCIIQLLELQLHRYYGNPPPSLHLLPRNSPAPPVMCVFRLFYSVFGTSDVSPDLTV